MSHRKANFQKDVGSKPGQDSKRLLISKGANQHNQPNYIMLILSFVVKLLTFFLVFAKNRKNRLNP
jgi:hypothetical protein